MEYRFLRFVSTCNNDFEASSTSLMSLWANIKFFPGPTGELYGWLLETLVLLILQYPDHHQNLISSSLYYSGPVPKISSKSIHNFLARRGRMSSERYCHTPSIVVVVVVVVDNFRLTFLFINLSQVKVSVY